MVVHSKIENSISFDLGFLHLSWNAVKGARLQEVEIGSRWIIVGNILFKNKFSDNVNLSVVLSKNLELTILY